VNDVRDAFLVVLLMVFTVTMLAGVKTLYEKVSWYETREIIFEMYDPQKVSQIQDLADEEGWELVGFHLDGCGGGWITVRRFKI
jgi:hypothetical protein